MTTDTEKPQLTDEKIIDGYVRLRDKVEKAERDLKAQLLPIRNTMDALQTEMHKRFLERGTKGSKAATGTAFFKTVSSVKVVNFIETLEVIKKEGRWSLLEARISKKGAMDYKEETGDILPGTALSEFTEVQFNRPR